MAQRNGDGHIRIYVALREPEHWAKSCGIDFDEPVAARQSLLKGIVRLLGRSRKMA